MEKHVWQQLQFISVVGINWRGFSNQKTADLAAEKCSHYDHQGLHFFLVWKTTAGGVNLFNDSLKKSIVYFIGHKMCCNCRGFVEKYCR